MAQCNVDQFMIRLQSLERQNRNLRFVVFVVAALGGLFVLSGATNQRADMLTTKRLAIVDDDNRERIVLEAPDKKAADVNPKVYIRINDEAGYPTTGVLQFKDMSTFWASRFSTRESFAILSSVQDSASLNLWNGTNPSVEAFSRHGSAALNVGGAAGATLQSDGKTRSANIGNRGVLAAVDQSGVPEFRVQKVSSLEALSEPKSPFSIKNNQFEYQP